jgi:hypothetical protein
MTIKHISHFGLEQVGQTEDNILFSGSLSACKRLAAFHGCSVKSEERMIETPKIARYWLETHDGQHGGSIHIGRDDWTLVLPVKVWQES